MGKGGKIIFVVILVLCLLCTGVTVAAGFFVYNRTQVELRRQEAITYNDNLVDYQLKFRDAVTGLDQTLQTVTDRTEAEEAVTETVAQLDTYLSEVGTLVRPNNSDAFHNSAGNLFSAYRETVAVDYKDVVVDLLFTSALSLSEVNSKLEEKFDEINTEIETLNNEFIAQQEVFAKSYNFELLDNAN